LTDEAVDLVLRAIVVCVGLVVLGIIVWNSFSPPAPPPLSEPPQYPYEAYQEGTLKQRVHTAETDLRVAKKLFDQGKRREAYEVLGKAEDKYALGEQEKADLTKLKEMILEVETKNSTFIKGVRRKSAAVRLRSKAEKLQAALRVLEYRNRVWGEVLEVVQGRMRGQTPGAESYVESPFRVEPAFLREALARRYGKAYLSELEKLAPGVLVKAVQDAEALGEKTGAR
jgi:hypothetical protein